MHRLSDLCFSLIQVSVCDNGFSGVDTSAHTSEDFGEQVLPAVVEL